MDGEAEQMIDPEVVEKGLSALSTAAAELLEDIHDELVSTLPADRRLLT